MSKYKGLLKNTIVLGISSIFSRLFIFLMVPLYTSFLTTTEVGDADLIMNVCNILFPILTLGFVDSVIRFVMDESYDEQMIFSIGIRIIITGLIVLIVILLIFSFVKYIRLYYVYIILLYLTVTVHQLMAQFLKAVGRMKLFALDTILLGCIQLFCCLIFFVVLETGMEGYFLAIICSNFICNVLIFVFGKMWRYAYFGKINKNKLKNILSYCAPLVPNSISWWITNSSDKVLIVLFMGAHFNGLYSVAYKIPTIITALSSVFMQAWQIAYLKVNSDDEKLEFLNEVNFGFGSSVFVVTSLVILNSEILAKFMFASEFFSAWRYIPLLMIAAVLGSYTNFYGTIYSFTLKTRLGLRTTVIGALVNILFNLILIPLTGVFGAVVSTVISYFVVLVLREYDAISLLGLASNKKYIFVNLFLLCIQSIILISQLKLRYVLSIFIFVVIVKMNFKTLVRFSSLFMSNMKSYANVS